MSTSRSNTNKALVTGIAMMDTREINPNIIDVALETGYDDLMKMAGVYKKTSQPNYHHFVNEDLQQVLVFTAVSGSGTPTLTITIASTGFARRDGKYKFSNSRVGKIGSAISSSGGQDSFTITSVDGTNLSAIVGDKISSLGITTGEGSDEVAVLNYGQTKYFNFVEHLKDKREITDIQAGSKVTVGTGYYAFVEAMDQATSFKQTISATLVGGNKSVNEYGSASPSLLDQFGNSVQTTGGVDQEIGNYGINATVATQGTFLLSDVDTLLDQMLAVKSPSQYMLLCPSAAKRKSDAMWKNMGSSGVQSVKIDFDGKAIDFQVDQVSYGGRTLDFGSLNLLDHPQLFNFVGSSAISKTIYGIPKDKVKVQAGPGGKGGVETRIGVRYLQNEYVASNQGTDMIREWYTGALTENPTSGKEVRTCHISTTQGNECLGTRQMFKMRVLA